MLRLSLRSLHPISPPPTLSAVSSSSSSSSSSSPAEMLRVSVAVLFVCLPSGSPGTTGFYPTVESVPSMNSLLFAQLPFRLPDDCSNISLEFASHL